MYISLVVPCFNEENNIEPFYNAVEGVFGKNFDNTELIFINDGSHDNTMQELKKIYNKNKNNVKIINFSRNFGKEAALLAGLKKSTGEYVSIIDADLQQDPKYLIQMIKFLDNNPQYDAVAAYQQIRKEDKMLTFFKNIFYNLINRISEVEFVKSASDFRTLRRSVVDAIIQLPEKCRFSKGIFSWVGFDTYYMEYQVQSRNSGESKWNFMKLFKYAINGIISFSNIPLITSSIMGILFCLLSFLYMIFVIIKTIMFGESVAGFPTIVCILLFISGLQLLFIGILGQYIAKTFTETKNRPVYIIKEYLE